MTNYHAVFSANLHVDVQAKDVREARALASEIAHKAAVEFDGMTVQAEDWIVIHDDDLLSIVETEE